eukprot:g7490.t1
MSDDGVIAILAPFEDPNSFEVLQPFHDESIPDVEPTEQILLRVMRSSLEKAERDSEQDGLKLTTSKMRTFQEGELDASWTIVARRRTSSYQQIIPEEEVTPTPTASTSVPSEKAEVTMKPRRLWKWLAAAGVVTVAGVVSFFVLKPKNKKNE